MSKSTYSRAALPAADSRRSPLVALAFALSVALLATGWSGDAFAQASSGSTGTSGGDTGSAGSSNATGDAPGQGDGGAAGVSGMQTGTAGDLSGMMGEQGERVIVIDVRSRRDFARSHVPNAINLNVRYSEVLREHVIDDKSAFGPDKSARIVVYGYRSDDPAAVAVVRRAAAEGYTNVIWMRGGFAEWVSARLPVATGRNLTASAPR